MEDFWATVWTITPWAILFICAAVGLVGSLLPGIPGGSLIVVGALIFAIMTDFVWISWPTLLLLVLLALIGGIGQYFISGYGAQKFGASKWGAIGAFAGFIVGMMIWPPIGALLGAFLGAMLVELYLNRKKEEEEGKGTKQAALAGIGAVIGSVASFMFEFMFGLAMVAMLIFGLMI